MQCPRLSDLPAPPPDRRGWPWTEEAPPLPAPAPGAAPLPKVTVVVPSYQQARFLEETLRSVLLQGYPDLELLVMDGGSTDGSTDIIRRYEPWIAGWVSEKDGGQTQAINKGWRRATGELLTWLNSDDILYPGWAEALTAPLVADPGLDLAFDDAQVIDAQDAPLWVYAGEMPNVESMLITWHTPFAQQGFLMRRRLLEECGYLDERLFFTMDTEYWLRLAHAGRRFHHVQRRLAALRLHEETKSSRHAHVHIDNLIDITKEFCDRAPPEMAALTARVRRRLNWNIAHAKYDSRYHTEARQYALRYLADGGWRALPQAAAMVGLSFLGDPGHHLLSWFRRLRASGLGGVASQALRA